MRSLEQALRVFCFNTVFSVASFRLFCRALFFVVCKTFIMKQTFIFSFVLNLASSDYPSNIYETVNKLLFNSHYSCYQNFRNTLSQIQLRAKLLSSSTRGIPIRLTRCVDCTKRRQKLCKLSISDVESADGRVSDVIRWRNYFSAWMTRPRDSKFVKLHRFTC